MKIGFIGLGKMGTRMVQKILDGGHEVVGWNRSKDVLAQFTLHITELHLEQQFTGVHEVEEIFHAVSKPRVIWSMLPAGEPTENILEEIAKHAEEGDIVIDGGNAFYKDTERRYKSFQEKGIRFLGIGVSGGVKAPENGYPLMVGGDRSAYDHIEPVLDSLMQPNGGHAYFGEGGAGHFVKMVHNGIEYGMMQAIGEGFGVIDRAPYDFELDKVAKLWQKGTIVSGFLMDRAADALEKDPKLSEIVGEIDATGEAEWTVTQAASERVPIENIDQSLKFRRQSKSDPAVSQSFAARLIAALRFEFGGHAVKKK